MACCLDPEKLAFFSAIWGWSTFDAIWLRFGAPLRKVRMGRFVRNFLVSFHRLRLQDPPAPVALKTFMSHLNAAGLSAFVTHSRSSCCRSSRSRSPTRSPSCATPPPSTVRPLIRSRPRSTARVRRERCEHCVHTFFSPHLAPRKRQFK